jgi:nucleotide-binding universal stress UspA family protein
MQLRKILAAVKPTSPDAHPLCAAIELAARARANLTVLGVTESPWQLLGPEAQDSGAAMPSRGELVALATARIEERVRPLLAPRLGDRATVHAAIGLPAIEIARWSESDGTDLIVLGREAQTRAPRVDAADTVEGTVRRARVPCLLAPAGGTPFKRILAAVDGGPDTKEIIEAALAIGRLFAAAVRALHVEAPALAGVGATSWAHDAPRWGEQHAETGCDTILREGDPVVEILRVVRDEAVDLLVLGHHRGGPSGGHATSGVAPRLLQRAPCAVLTVPV